MRKAVLIISVAAPLWLVGSPVAAAPADDATVFIKTVMDKFNGGDAKAFVAAHETNALIVDEFGRHVWTGSATAQHWLPAYLSANRIGLTLRPRGACSSNAGYPPIYPRCLTCAGFWALFADEGLAVPGGARSGDAPYGLGEARAPATSG